MNDGPARSPAEVGSDEPRENFRNGSTVRDDDIAVTVRASTFQMEQLRDENRRLRHLLERTKLELTRCIEVIDALMVKRRG